MKSILYIQGQKDDTIIIDGKEPVPFSVDNNEHRDAAHCLNSATNWMKIPHQQEDGNLRCYRSENGIYIQSNYRDTDDVGRLIMFRFYTDLRSLGQACKILKDMSAKALRQCDDAEFHSLKIRDKSVNEDSFLFYRDTLIDDNGNTVSPDNPKYQSMMLKFEQKGNRQLENGSYFLKSQPKQKNKSWFNDLVDKGRDLVDKGRDFLNLQRASKNVDYDQIYLIQSVFDDGIYKFWIENPKNIDDTINHLTNLSKYFDKSVNETDIKTLQSKSNYGK